MNADQALLAIASGSEVMPTIEHALDQLTISVDLFDVPTAGFGGALGACRQMHGSRVRTVRA
jgi:hypothetical protein